MLQPFFIDLIHDLIHKNENIAFWMGNYQNGQSSIEVGSSSHESL